MRARLNLGLTLLLASASLMVTGPAQAAGEADLAVSVSAPSTAYVGQVFDLTVFTENRGPSSAEDVTLVVTATGPVSMSPPAGCVSESPTRLVCSLATMHYLSPVPPKQIPARAHGTGTVTFTAEISSPTPDPDATNNSDTAALEVMPDGPADLSVGVSAPASMTVGQPTNYFVQYGNSGPADATSVTLVSTVSPNLEIYGFAHPECTSTTTEVSCTFSQVHAQTQGILTIPVRPVAAGTATITGTISSSVNPDPNPSNNTSSVTVSVAASADLGVTVTESADPVKSRRDLTLSSTVTNTGPSGATGTTLRYDLAADGLHDLSVVSATSSQGTCAVSTGIVTCDLGTIASGGSASVDVVVRAKGNGIITTTASVTSADPDPSTANNSVTETTRVSTSGH